MPKAQETPEVPESVEEAFEDDPRLRKLFKNYLAEALTEFFAEHETEEAVDDDGAGSTRDGTGGTEAGKARAETSESKTKQIVSIFARK